MRQNRTLAEVAEGFVRCLSAQTDTPVDLVVGPNAASQADPGHDEPVRIEVAFVGFDLTGMERRAEFTSRNLALRLAVLVSGPPPGALTALHQALETIEASEDYQLEAGCLPDSWWLATGRAPRPAAVVTAVAEVVQLRAPGPPVQEFVLHSTSHPARSTPVDQDTKGIA